MYTANPGETAACLIATRDYKEVGSWSGAAVRSTANHSHGDTSKSSFLDRLSGSTLLQSERRQENPRRKTEMEGQDIDVPVKQPSTSFLACCVLLL